MRALAFKVNKAGIQLPEFTGTKRLFNFGGNTRYTATEEFDYKTYSIPGDIVLGNLFCLSDGNYDNEDVIFCKILGTETVKVIAGNSKLTETNMTLKQLINDTQYNQFCYNRDIEATLKQIANN